MAPTDSSLAAACNSRPKGNPAALARVAISTGVATAVVPYYETPRSLARPPLSGTSGPTVLVRTGGSLLVAGDFFDYGVTARNRLAAYDLATGALSFRVRSRPRCAGQPVKAAADNTAVFVGGEFTSIAGEGHNRLAKLSISTGGTCRAYPDANSYVKDMAVRPDGAAVYVGGNSARSTAFRRPGLLRSTPTPGRYGRISPCR